MDNSDRRKEILNVCLDTFINKGLSETTVRDLSTALKLQSGGIYYWFKDKDEAVVACAEEAALRLENSLILQVYARCQSTRSVCSQCSTVWRNVTKHMHGAFQKN